ncbi:MAG: hypothetical protein RL701_3629 [Pseudomonadota bacterium]
MIERDRPADTIARSRPAPGTSQAPRSRFVIADGTQIGRFIVEDVIGKGGGGIIYSARERALGTRVAIKALRAELVSDPGVVERFVREAQALAKIRHPNIVQVFEIGEVERGRPYYAMELLGGIDLHRKQALHGRFSPQELLELLEPICDAVQATHLAGFIHRDIKAGNVMISEVDGRREVKLLDFGIAKLVKASAPEPGLTEPGAFLGTAFSMPPEQIRCEPLDARVDIYALGVLIYHMLTGEYPFEASDPREIVRLHLYAPPPRPSQRAPVSPALDAVVLRCLEKRPEQRFGNVPELISALRSAVNDTRCDAAETTARALGVYVNLTSKLHEVIDDDMFEAMGEVLDAVELTLSKLDFALPFRGTNALLAVRLLDTDTTGNVHSQTLASLLALRTRVAKRADLNIEISVAVDTARYRKTREHTEIIGGPLLDPSVWSAHPDAIHV